MRAMRPDDNGQDGGDGGPGRRLMALALVIAIVAVPGWLFRANEHTGPEPFNNGPYQAALAIAAVLFLGGAVLERKD